MIATAVSIAYLIGILSLVKVDKRSIRHVARIDEELGSPHGLEKVPGSLKLSHKLNKQLRSSVCIDAIHETIDRASEAVGRRGNAAISLNGRIRPVGRRCNREAAQGSSSRASLSSCIVGLTVSHDAHADEHDQKIQDHRKIGQEAELVQGSDLAREEANNRPDQAAHNVAKVEL